MKTYGSKEELKAEIQRSLDTYLAEFDAIPESARTCAYPMQTAHRRKIWRTKWLDDPAFAVGGRRAARAGGTVNF